MSYQYAKFKENSCVGTDVSTPFIYAVILTRASFGLLPVFFAVCNRVMALGLFLNFISAL